MLCVGNRDHLMFSHRFLKDSGHWRGEMGVETNGTGAVHRDKTVVITVTGIILL